MTFLVKSLLFAGTLFMVLHAAIMTPNRINSDIFAEAFLKGCQIFDSKVHFFMVTKNQMKLITGLHQKKFRMAHGLFIAEGLKVISELLQSDMKLNHLYETESLFPEISPDIRTQVSWAELQKMSALNTANNCLAIFEIPKEKNVKQTGLIVVLDDVRDPGNLGTLIRICDWFGVEQLVCSSTTADLYNPKVVQATMGSLARVQVNYVDLSDWLDRQKLPVYGTFMSGSNLHEERLPTDGIVIFGNEANGISGTVEEKIQHRLSIPRFGRLKQTESLNVATAAAIVLSEFRRLTVSPTEQAINER